MLEPMHETAAARQKRRATWVGAVVNLPLALGKILLGWLSASQALVADGVHSFSDLISDAAVFWALGHSRRPPDAEHPFGHGRFETIATLAVATMLVAAAFGIFFDSLSRALRPSDEPPALFALVGAAVSIAVKEALFHYTRAIALKTRSDLLLANAWHHRSDAISSIVAVIGISAAQLGFPLADPVAAAVIAVMLFHIALKLGRPAFAELVDTAPEPEIIARIETELRAVPGVHDVHDLRLRRIGPWLRGSAHVTFDGHMTLSEAHRLTEAARARARAAVPELADLVLHAEPEGHADGPAAHDSPLRPEIEALVRKVLRDAASDACMVALRLDYRDDGLHVELLLDPPLAQPDALRERLTEALAAMLGQRVIVDLMARSR